MKPLIYIGATPTVIVQDDGRDVICVRGEERLFTDAIAAELVEQGTFKKPPPKKRKKAATTKPAAKAPPTGSSNL